jgi:hypothetical protein
MEYTLEVAEQQRELALSGDLTWQREAESLACFKGVWDEGLGVARPTLANLIAKEKRKGKCYFFPYQCGMLLPAGERLQQHQQARADDSSKYRLTIYALVLTILGLVAKLLYDHSQ